MKEKHVRRGFDLYVFPRELIWFQQLWRTYRQAVWRQNRLRQETGGRGGVEHGAKANTRLATQVYNSSSNGKKKNPWMRSSSSSSLAAALGPELQLAGRIGCR